VPLETASPTFADAAKIHALSQRERQLLKLAAEGLTDQGIAHRLGISLATISTYWVRIRGKLGQFNRTELVAHYLRDLAARDVIELREQNRQLLASLSVQVETADALRASLSLFYGLVEAAPDAILVVNSDGIVELANLAGAELFGYTEEELTGQTLEDLSLESIRDFAAGDAPLQRRMSENITALARRKDGSTFRAAIALSSTLTTDGVLLTCIIREN